MSVKKRDEKLRRVSSAADNMSALIDDVVKTARKSFRATGDPKIDAKFLKESVGALRELYGLIEDCDGVAGATDGVLIKIEREIQEWSK